jgi:endonuclease/exonuclease/phosphatase family metal-dependent hydrolase
MSVRVCRWIRIPCSPRLLAWRRPALLERATLAATLLVASTSIAAAQGRAVPGTIEAVDFDNGPNGVAYFDLTPGNAGGEYRSTDVDIQACWEGGFNIGWAGAGEWLNYTVTAAASGTYALDLRVASIGGGRAHIEVNGENATGPIVVPDTGDWQSWTTVRTLANIPAGTQVLRLVFETRGININRIDVQVAGAAGASARSLPGTIEAEDFDDGPNGTAYFDTTSGNVGGSYRNTDVDIEPSSEGGFDVGWTRAGEWLGYTLSVASAGTYTIELRMASPSGASAHVEFNGANVTGNINVPSTGGWQEWTTVRATANLSAGTQQMRVVFDTSGVNLNWINVTSGGSVSAVAPFGGTPWTIPGTIQAEDFDTGPLGAAYLDNSPGNSGGSYRGTDVDIEQIPTGYALDWVYGGEWLRYTVNVTSSGQYTAVVRVASLGTGGTFHIAFDGVDQTGQMRVPNTGGWGTYQDVSAAVTLEAGVHVMHLVFDSNGSGAVGNFNWLRFDPGVAAAPAPTPAPTGGKLRVMTWNIDFGGGGSLANPWGQAQLIANSGADVVLLQEAQRWDEDMTVTYPDRLRQLTGQSWSVVWSPHDNGGEGTLILTRLPVLDQSIHSAFGRGFGRVLVNVGGVAVNLFDVHLDWSDTSKRSAELEDFLAWSASFGGPRIAGGDFNSWWGEWWILRTIQSYSDTWVDVTGSNENGYTLNGAVRFDYLFRAFDQNWRLTPTSCWVQSTGLSDHSPVLADYTIR